VAPLPFFASFGIANAEDASNPYDLKITIAGFFDSVDTKKFERIAK
jgi:hypothetical protein